MKEEFKPSEHQQNIYDFIENGTQNGVVSAVAGSGKTTTLVHAIDKIPLNKSILFMAFNKSIAIELSNRITPQPNITIKTVHAFGMNLIVNQLPFKEQQTSKYKSLLRTILANKPLNEYNLNTTQYEWVNELRIDEEKRTQIENIIEYVNIIGDLTDLGRMNLINITDPIKGVEEICNIAKHHGITTCNQECTSAWYLIKLGSSITSIIDFTDMVYLPLIHNLEIPKYDFVFIDECFPFNTFISTENGRIKIGQLEKNYNNGLELPMVTSFNEITKQFENKKIKKVWCNGIKDVYEVILGGKRKIKSTKNHKFLTYKGWVKMEDLKIGDAILSNYTEQPYHTIYEGDKLEIILGTSIGDGSIFNLTNNTYRIRCIHGQKQEEYIRWKADILNSNIEIVEENGYALKKAFRFTTKGFYYDNLSKINVIKNITAKSLAVLFMDDGHLSLNGLTVTLHSLSEYPDLVTELQKMLKDKFDIDSIFSSSKSSSTKKLNYFLRLNKANVEKISLLIAPYMHPSMVYKVLEKHRGLCNLKNWDNIYDNEFGCMVVTKEMQFVKTEKVYDMEVEDNHNFIVTSNTWTKKVKAKDFGLIAHNCQDINACQRQMMLECIESNGGRFIAVGDEHQAIYGFSGADADSFNKLRNIPNTIELPLSVSYRCATSIIDMVKSFVSHILPKDNAIKGSFNPNKSYNDVRDGDMVLCRQTFPLVSLCLKYLSMGIKAYVNGSDIGKTLSKMIMDSKQDSNWTMQYVYSYLYSEREKMVQNAITKENLSRGEAFETTSVRNHTEKIQVIELLGKDTTNPQDVIDKINKIFSDDDKSGIMLSTIHKAKGLESENVFIIHGELMPSKHATKPWEIIQEQNLRYVAYTRAKSHLAFITDFDAFKTHTSQENNVKPIAQSKHIGQVGQRIALTAEIFNLKPITTRNGSSTILIEMKDSSGNIFTKFGDINTKHIISHHKVLTKGAKVRIMGEIKDHSEFRGVKSTLINIPPKFN